MSFFLLYWCCSFNYCCCCFDNVVYGSVGAIITVCAVVIFFAFVTVFAVFIIVAVIDGVAVAVIDGVAVVAVLAVLDVLDVLDILDVLDDNPVPVNPVNFDCARSDFNFVVVLEYGELWESVQRGREDQQGCWRNYWCLQTGNKKFKEKQVKENIKKKSP